MSGRNFRRLCVRYEKDGIEGPRDRRIGKVSPPDYNARFAVVAAETDPLSCPMSAGAS
jgi:hypothetical protein